jgi:hypothetical protein
MASGLPARWVLVCAVLAAAQGGSIAHAQRVERRGVAVIDLSTSPEGDKLARELNGVLSNHIDLQTVNFTWFRSLQGPFANEERPALETAQREKQAAEDFLVNQLDYRSTEAAADRGMQALQNVRPTPEVLGLYAELAFTSGQAALKLRKPNDAAVEFGLSFRLDPAKRPDPTRYEPDIVEAYALAAGKTSAPVKLEVKGAGTVWIDGVDRGAAPGTFDVVPGLHLVQLSGPERETRGRQVDVPQTPSVEIEAAPASDERKVERARIELAHANDAAARAGAMKKLAQLLGVGDAVLITKAADGSLEVQTWRDRAPGFSKPTAYREGKVDDVLAPLAPPRKPEPPKKPETPFVPVTPVEAPIYRKAWFKGTVAAGVIAVAATIIIIANQDRMLGFDQDIKPVGE